MQQPRHWKKLERHPLSAEYPDLPPVLAAQMRADLKAHGIRNGRKVILFEGKVLDGWQFLQACIAENIKPKFDQLPRGMDPVAYVRMMNDNRRHETETIRQQRAEERRKRVEAGKLEGKSIREMATEEGVAPTTIQRDLESVPPGTPKTSETLGKVDSSAQESAISGTKIYCVTCQHRISIGRELPASCPQCQEARHAANPPKKREPRPDTETPPVDAFGNEIPRRCRDAYCDPFRQDALDVMAEVSEKIRSARLMDGMDKRKKHYPFYRAKDFVDGINRIIHDLDSCLEHIKDFEPAGVCPACKGKGCGECIQSGMVPRAAYERLKKLHK